MAYRTFSAAEILTAANVMTYLMKQAVIVCTSGTRPASPPEGMTVYETDTDVFSVYNGSAWKRIAHDQETNTTQQGTETTTQASITSTSFAAGAQNCYTTFTPPRSGAVLITVHGNCNQSSNSFITHLSYEIRDNATPGGGSEIVAPSSVRGVSTTKAVVASGPAYINASWGPYLTTGLTPGTVHNARTMHQVSGGTGTIAYRAITVTPVP